ncbi:MAG: RnfABCDGE type electron transport complex subunit G [Alistipes sp.]|nr:RnfABCDGE type electron transport complex subunit G [Alistipes sp.]
MKSSLKNMVLVLFTITAVSALLVGLVNNITKDVIAQTEVMAKNEAKFKVLNVNAEEAVVLQDEVIAISDFEIIVSTVVAVEDNSHILGYAVEAPSITKSGYGGRIKLMVGFVESDGVAVVNGVEVLSQNETPGLGANMTKAGNALEKSMLGKNPEELSFKVKKDDANGSFDSLTGSTISSRAYANAVETAYAGYLKAKGLLDADAVGVSGATSTNDTVSGATDTDWNEENNVTEEEK